MNPCSRCKSAPRAGGKGIRHCVGCQAEIQEERRAQLASTRQNEVPEGGQSTLAIAVELGVSGTRVKQILEKAQRKFIENWTKMFGEPP